MRQKSAHKKTRSPGHKNNKDTIVLNELLVNHFFSEPRIVVKMFSKKTCYAQNQTVDKITL